MPEDLGLLSWLLGGGPQKQEEEVEEKGRNKQVKLVHSALFNPDPDLDRSWRKTFVTIRFRLF